MSKFKQMKRIVIEDLKTLQVLAHPLRSQILDVFCEEPLTVKQAAGRLGLTANKLYYHVNLLEQHGLLRIVETRTVGNMIEKLYRTVAEQFKIDANLLSFSDSADQEGAEQLVVSALDTTREDVLRSMEVTRLQRLQGNELKPRQATVTRCLSRLSDARAEDFRKRLCTLVEEFGQADEKSSLGDGRESGTESDVQTYALTVAFYATWHFPEQDE
jgi:DNA-binding transcriptional ArsR family regulator